MIDITNVDLRQFVKEVYNLSAPQGLGFLHFTPTPLSEEDVDKILANKEDRVVLDMDYVKGRACKMVVWKSHDGGMEIKNGWYDHTDTQLVKLLQTCGLDIKADDINKEHGCSCNCGDCRALRGE
jgi:hypothetical protein